MRQCAPDTHAKGCTDYQDPELITQLRKHIREGRRQPHVPSLHNYIDGVTFWKDSCRQAEAKQEELRLRVDELEREKVDLLAQLGSTERVSIRTGLGKRRKTDGEMRGDGTVRARTRGMEGFAREVNPLEIDAVGLEAPEYRAESKHFSCATCVRPDEIQTRRAFHAPSLLILSNLGTRPA